MKFQNYINGKWVKGKSAFQTINPANEEIVAEIAQAEISDVDAAVSAAKNCSSRSAIFSNRKRKNSRNCSRATWAK